MINGITVDSSGNEFVNVGTVRLTYIKAENRDEKKNWAGQDVIRIQAYKDDSNQLHQGAEIPIGDRESSLDLLLGVAMLLTGK